MGLDYWLETLSSGQTTDHAFLLSIHKACPSFSQLSQPVRASKLFELYAKLIKMFD